MFKIRDLGVPSRFFLGIQIVFLPDGIVLSQRRYMTDILQCAGILECKPLATPILVSRPTVASIDSYYDPTQ